MITLSDNEQGDILEIISSDKELDEDAIKKIMIGRACQYPKEDLQPMKKAFEETGSIEVPHKMLQDKFEDFLRADIGLNPGQMKEIVSKGWGSAGIIDGDRILATKIPKSGNLLKYLAEPDPERRRELYCHCPTVRDALSKGETVPPIYCYCGAGFYKFLWEEITQSPVDVEVLASILNGDDVCTIAITFPSDSE